MTEITFQLIRKCNADLSFDDIVDVTSIKLNNCSIECIDNLELFEHIKELHLNRNLITQIDNLEMFHRLELLDVSFNRIDSKGLVASFEHIPHSLDVINLTGNPCVHDESVLIKLQDKFPHLGIVIDELDVDATEANNDNSDDDDEAEDDRFDFDDTPTGRKEGESPRSSLPLSSEDVLRCIVDRKSKLQSYERFNLDNTVTELNSELDRAIEATDSVNRGRRERIKAKESSRSQSAAQYLEKLQLRKQQLLNNSSSTKSQYDTKFEDLMKNLKISAAEHIATIKRESMVSKSGGDDTS